MTMHFPAALFLPKDAFDTASQQVLGRRVAGAQLAQAFAGSLEAEEMLTIASPGEQAVEAVRQLLGSHMPAGALLRVGGQPTTELLQDVGALYVPDPLIGRWTPLRQGLSPVAFSLTGVIHTVCSESALGGIANVPLAPLYPWDAIVCTSRAGRDVVAKVLEYRIGVMASRLGVAPGAASALRLPQLPVIPLVASAHQPFAPGLSRSMRRAQARQELGLPAEAFVVAFVGRLSFHSKCHPLNFYRALDRLAAESPEREVVLVECGHIFNEGIAAVYAELRPEFPNLKFRLVGGLKPADDYEKWRALAAADVFTSPADSLQETFGLSLLEAMAAELPLVVSDWNGYRDLVEDGVNGFLVPTADVLRDLEESDEIDAEFALGTLDYDSMVGVRSLGVIVRQDAYLAALRTLRDRPGLRDQMASASLDRLQRCYSPCAVVASYRDLWGSLAELRASAACDPELSQPLPELMPGYAEIFDHYSSTSVLSRYAMPVGVAPSVKQRLQAPMNAWLVERLAGARVGEMIQLLEAGKLQAVDDFLAAGWTKAQALRLVAVLHKLAADG